MAVYIIGDVHGHLVKLIELLVDAELMDEGRRWSGGTSHLWFLGDFFDRGPHGIEVVELIMRLQTQAEEAGGEIRALLGNHEILFLAAHRFRGVRKVMLNWKRNGGQDNDMATVSSRQIAWLRNLPALALVEDRLLMHADAMFYLNYGASIAEVNETISELLRTNELDDWERLLDDFAERMAFGAKHGDGGDNVLECLRVFGGKQIIHGHTPIQYVTEAATPKYPLVYMNKLCVDVDGGMYLGGPGFVYQLPD